MKLFYITPLAIAASAAAIGLAPIASADASVQQSPGNAQVTATPRGSRATGCSTPAPIRRGYGRPALRPPRITIMRLGWESTASRPKRYELGAQGKPGRSRRRDTVVDGAEVDVGAL